jgi:hypothetical protein
LPLVPLSFFSRSSGRLCLKKRTFAFERMAPSTMLAWTFWSMMTQSPGRISAEMSPTFVL